MGDFLISDIDRDLLEISEEMKKVTDHSTFRQVIDASDDAQTIVICFRQVSNSINAFVVR
jgi:hypothetical protein